MGVYMQFDELWKDGPKYTQEQGVFPLGSDSVWLGGFVSLSGVKSALDIGCGGGALSIMLLGRKPSVKTYAVDISKKAVELTRKNAEVNGYDINAVCGDIKNYRELFITDENTVNSDLSGYFDLVITNPPYFREGSGKKAAGNERALAREENECSLDDICKAAAYFCRWGGRFAVVYRPERLSQLCCAMTANGIEPKRMKFVLKTAENRPIVVLVEGRRGGKPGLKIEPPLILSCRGGYYPPV
jgi:tRNA1Val (adenine37-N6)-methyltransferase